MGIRINHLDLFSGIGGFHMGFERAGFEPNVYFSEVDKHAVAVYKNQFKGANYVGSVVDVRGSELPRIDLITFGSPCQDFSLAGKRQGMGGERSSLILEAIRLIGECRPRVFIWENVKGAFSSNNGEDFAAILQEFANIGGYRLEWQLLNTSWFLPQNRERIYLVGYSTTPERGWRGVFPIGESGGEDRGQLKQKNGKLQQTQSENIHARALSTAKMAIDSTFIRIKSATKQGYEEAREGDSINLSNPNSETRRGRVGRGKAQTLETSCNQAVLAPKIIGYTREMVDGKVEITKRHLKDHAGTIHSATGSGGNTDQFVKSYKSKALRETLECNELKEGEVKALDLYNRTVRDECPTLTDPTHNSTRLHDGCRIRRLTPIECERLQGFPDNHTEFGNYDGEVKKVSNTQRYKQCGNAVTVDVVQAIAEKIKPLFYE